MLPGMAQSPDETTGLPWYRGLGPLAPLPTEHTRCVCTVTMGRQWLCPHHRGQDASTPKYKTKPSPEKTAKAIHGLLGCLFQEQLRNGKEVAGQVTFARIQNPCIIRVGLWNVLPSHTPSQPSTWLGEVKLVQKPTWWSGARTVTHRQLTLPQHKEDNKDDLSFWVTTASKLWVGCPSLLSLSLFLFTKQRSSSGETEAVRCADKSPPNRTTYWRERGQEFSAPNTAKVELLRTAPG